MGTHLQQHGLLAERLATSLSEALSYRTADRSYHGRHAMWGVYMFTNAAQIRCWALRRSVK